MPAEEPKRGPPPLLPPLVRVGDFGFAKIGGVVY